MEEKTFKISIPEGYEIDKKKSTFENIVFKKIEQGVKTWEDLIGSTLSGNSAYINLSGGIWHANGCITNFDKNVFIDERHAKSALAMAQISQLMPYYDKSITDEEWEDVDIDKFVIQRNGNEIAINVKWTEYRILAFHTREQAEKFLDNNERLVKDYLMLD